MQPEESVSRLFYAATHGVVLSAAQPCTVEELHFVDEKGSTSLMQAAKYGHADILFALLRMPHADVNAVDHAGKTALLYAAQTGVVKSIKALMSHGAECHSGKTSELHVAIRNRHVGAALFFIKNGFPFNAQDDEGCTALLCALKYEVPEVVKALLEESADVTPASKQGETALMAAMAPANLSFVPALLAARSNVNAMDSEARSALYLAATREDEATVALLLRAGADPNVAVKGAVNAVSGNILRQKLLSQNGLPLILLTLADIFVALAADSKHILVNFMLDGGVSAQIIDTSGRTALIYAVRDGCVPLVKRLIAAGCDLNVHTRDNCTAVSIAAAHKDTTILRLLLAAGAQRSGQDLGQETPLLIAVKNGNIDAVRLLNADGCKYRATMGFNGLYPLPAYDTYEVRYADRVIYPFTCAVELGHLDILKLLLEDLDSKSMQRPLAAALHLAARLGDIPACTAILDAGMDVNAVTEDWVQQPTALMAAAAYGQLEVAQLLLDRGATFGVGPGSRCALALAAHYGHVEVVKLLIQVGAELEPESETGTTPLMAAAMGCKEETVQVLIDAGANVNAMDANGTTPILFVAYRGNTRVAELLLEAGADWNAVFEGPSHWIKAPTHLSVLQLAIFKGHTGVVDLLLQRGVSADSAQDEDSNTALMVAVRGAVDLSLVIRLLQCGADVNLRNNFGQTAIFMLFTPHITSHTFNEQDARTALSLLVEHGANVNTRDDQGHSPLMLVTQKHSSCTAQLIELGADVHAVDLQGNTPLLSSIGSRFQSTESLVLLLAAGADPSAANNAGMSPLLQAVAERHHEAVRLLLDAGADVMHADIEGYNALLVAEPRGLWGKREELNVLRDLLHAGVPVNHVSNDNTTSLIRFSKRNLIRSVVLMLAGGATFMDTASD